MRFYIYSRKSKFTGKGESVENQVQLATEYIERNYGPVQQHTIEVFEDEGFSGKNLSRPEFQRMLSLARKKKCDCVVCYRLDRISRNVSDFSSLLEEFDHLKITFICIKEQFDTSNPMGRAMMYIASVFAQLERETIAERIRDNMMLLARTGRWLGGTTPLGFQSTEVASETIDGKVKKSFKLKPCEQELDIVRVIYSKYRELRSLTKMETYLLQNGFKTRQGKDFSTIAVREILANPVYCVADQTAYDYFTKMEADVCYEKSDSQFDGIHGIAAYNRTTNEGKLQTKNPISEWIVTVGRHPGIIPSREWIEVQEIAKSNQPKQFAGRVQNSASLLSGLLVCARCGSFLRPRVNSNKRRDEHGNQTFAYLCDRKKKSKGTLCDLPNINGNQLDRIVCEEILKYEDDDSLIGQKLRALSRQTKGGASSSQISLETIRSQIESKKNEIDNLIHILGQSDSDGKLFEYTSQKVDQLDAEILELKKEAFRLEQEIEANTNFAQQTDILYGALKAFSQNFQTSTVLEKRAFLRSIIEKVTWDGKEIHIFLLGEPEK